jgi:hypothetical protein
MHFEVDNVQTDRSRSHNLGDLPWVRSRQEQLEADLTNAWSQDPLLLFQTGVHGGYTSESGKTN